MDLLDALGDCANFESANKMEYAMSDEKIGKLYEKLRKLMALKNSALEVGSVGEAEAAAAAIQRLLRDYNLSEEEIPLEERVANPIVVEELNYYFVYRNNWHRDFIIVLANANLCQVLREYSIQGNRKIPMKKLVVGRRTNVDVVLFLASQLGNRLVAFCKAAYRQYVETKWEEGITAVPEQMFATNYLKGCVDGLARKLAEQNRPTEQSLVLSMNKEIDDFKEELYGKTKTAITRKQTVNHQDAYVAGYHKGRDVDIYEGIENQKKEVLILKD